MNGPINILIVDSAAETREQCRRFLHDDSERPYVVSEAEAGRAGVLRFGRQIPDCLLLNCTLPDMSGLDFLSEIGCDRDDSIVGVVMLADQASEKSAVRAMKLGAHDYLRKDALTASALSRAVGNVIGKVSMRRNLRQLQEKLLEAERECAAHRGVSKLARRMRETLTVLKGNLNLLTDTSFSDGDRGAFVADCLESVSMLDQILDEIQPSQE
ncbi:response regulator [Planctomycetota bacterium]